ncbi:type II toxin-antitoxin system Phd/YefM family antitoxin [Arsenicicoccus cauae]|uniref:Antitoxin n=1 Tax=Arsenicicoccus cauae TaxID=2663847 RepID=A0A6I3IBW2_9MICO|nr:type II toxin-antitoxin system Phd/YefM family antitoxin [Arsenicicoccus cauae]MTB71177.1 type II toxin-antitoxin system prevent-host-death family antitoxin [Arsenicicoccus cauae]
MSTHTVQSAKTHLSRILVEVEAGHEVTILRGKQPVARLVPAVAPSPRTFGAMRFEVPDDFDAPLSEEDLAAWE